MVPARQRYLEKLAAGEMADNEDQTVSEEAEVYPETPAAEMWGDMTGKGQTEDPGNNARHDAHNEVMTEGAEKERNEGNPSLLGRMFDGMTSSSNKEKSDLKANFANFKPGETISSNEMLKKVSQASFLDELSAIIGS